MKCEVCKKKEATKSSIINNTYYKSICEVCYERLISGQSPSSGQADYNRGRDIEEHEADIMQPYTDGKPDAKFIALYPETAHKLWSLDEIDRATRS